MARSRRNPIGRPAPAGVTLVRVGKEGEHTHVLAGGSPLCGSGRRKGNPTPLYRSDAQFITCYRCIKLVEGAARANPLQPVRTFSPSYDAESQEEYDRRVAEGKKRWEHRQVKGGRRAARFGEYGPYPRDPKKGGPRRVRGKIVGGEASPRDPEMAERTELRLQPRDKDGNIIPGTVPWEARTQAPLVWLETLQRMGYAVPEEELWEAKKRSLYATEEQAMIENPSYGRVYGKRVSKLERDIREGLRVYRSQQDDAAMGLYVPTFAGPLLEAGVPTKAAHELVRRAGGTFLSSTPAGAFAQFESTTDIGPMFVAKFGQMPGIAEGKSTRVTLPGKGHLQKVDVIIDKGQRQILLANASQIDRLFREWVGQLKGLGEWERGMGKRFARDFLFPWIDAGVRALAGGEPREVEFFVRFSGSKRSVRLNKSALQHSIVGARADAAPPVRYRTLKNVPLSKLPGILARIVSRTKREGRRLQPLSSTTESLENPMSQSYWTKQYSKGPYGSSRALPAARRNRGRARTKGGFSLPPAPDNKYVRMSAKQLKSDGSKGAKAELRRRAKNNASVDKQRASRKGRKSTGRKATSRKTTSRKSTGGSWQTLVKRAAKAGVYKIGMTRKQVEAALRRKSGKKTSTRKKAARKSAGKSSYAKDRATCIRLGCFKVGMTHAKMKAAIKRHSGKGKSRSTGRKTAARKSTSKKSTGGRKTTWPRFSATAAKRGYSRSAASARWKKYKAGKGTVDSLLPAKAKSRKAANNPKKRRNTSHKDRTHTREALVASDFDFWDDTHTREALTNHHRGMRGRSAHASDPWHPVYEQVIGQFSTGDDYTGGTQPVNRRNPKRKRKAKRNGKRKANPQAKRAMKLYHSGEYDSLRDAWDAVRNGR